LIVVITDEVRPPDSAMKNQTRNRKQGRAGSNG
jgi:hypothetical protein